MDAKTKISITLCKVIHSLMRSVGKNGRSLPGKIALKVQPDLIARLSEGHNAIAITGTNGKTTTTHIIQQGVINAFGGAAFDPTSTNLSQGVATTLALDMAGGKRKNDWAVIECDEGATKRVLPATNPKVLVITNLYRDQVDRYDSWTTARDYIIDALKKCPDILLVLDADCQVVASIAEYVDNPVVWYGIECDVYAPGVADYDEHVTCIKNDCDAELEYTHRTFAHLGNYSCPNCGAKHHDLDYAVTAIEAINDTSCSMTVRFPDGSTKKLPANIRAGYDVYNACAALAGLLEIGIDKEVAFASLEHFKHAMHRFEIFDVDGVQVRLLLMKNTAGANQLINMLVEEKLNPNKLACLLGAEIMDGRSTAWIEGVRWEKIVTPNTSIIVGGPEHEAMRQRLLRAGASEENINVRTDYAAIVQDMKSLARGGLYAEEGDVGFGDGKNEITVIANCSTIEALRVELVKQGFKPLDYWDEEE